MGRIPLTAQQQLVIAERRRIVGSLAARGVTQHEIIKALAEKGHVNPDTLEPWDQSTISRDIKTLVEEAKQSAIADIADHRARLLRELHEHRRQAWSENNLPEVRLGIKQEAELLGVNVPVDLNITHKGGAPARVVTIYMDPQPEPVETDGPG